MFDAVKLCSCIYDLSVLCLTEMMILELHVLIEAVEIENLLSL